MKPRLKAIVFSLRVSFWGTTVRLFPRWPLSIRKNGKRSAPNCSLTRRIRLRSKIRRPNALPCSGLRLLRPASPITGYRVR
ncbi:hypothetical protein EVA_02289 [gut metagenome]|uniref:Uncharacterized protein n=1 Tax=gut metagenome TaxID=749906 RepID=J9GPG6_9ZZZZ